MDSDPDSRCPDSHITCLKLAKLVEKPTISSDTFRSIDFKLIKQFTQKGQQVRFKVMMRVEEVIQGQM